MSQVSLGIITDRLDPQMRQGPIPPGIEYYECIFLPEEAWEIPEDDWLNEEQWLNVTGVEEFVAEWDSALGAPTGCRKPDNFPV